MCGRYTLERGEAEWSFADVRIEWRGPKRYNIAPSQRAPVIRVEHGSPAFAELRWGLLPSWAKDPKLAYSLINARSETAATKPAFRSAYRHRRCLVPADGFYEWQKLPGSTVKQPWRFVRLDRRPFLFAGLWESWRPEPNAAPLDTFTILTTTPNAVAAPVHDRMPVILENAAAQAWLAEATPPDALSALLRPAPDDALTRYPVSTAVNSPRNDGPGCVLELMDGGMR